MTAKQQEELDPQEQKQKLNKQDRLKLDEQQEQEGKLRQQDRLELEREQ